MAGEKPASRIAAHHATRQSAVCSKLYRVSIMRSIAICLFVAVLLAACARTPDEQRIRAAITTMQHAVETHDARGFIAYVSSDFSGNDGAVDRDGLANLLRSQVLRNEQVGVTLGPIDVELQGSRAIARVTATLTGGSGGLLPEHGAIYAFTSGWKKDGSDWRCYNASWEQKL
jgi:ketosteroid isomerase-like protein